MSFCLCTRRVATRKNIYNIYIYIYINGDFNVNTLLIYNRGLAKQEFINILLSSFFVL